jgi:GAF domain-containing protein
LPTDIALKARRKSAMVFPVWCSNIASRSLSPQESILNRGHGAINLEDMPASSMSVPLIGKNKMFGVLNVSKFSGALFTTSDLQIALILPSQVVTAMENAIALRRPA